MEKLRRPSSRPIHVFLSFRRDVDEDACKFTHRLSAAFSNAGLRTFEYDKDLAVKYHSHPRHVVEAIWETRVFVVVFSKNYAPSKYRWLYLQDLVQRRSVTLIPIFYHVDPNNDEIFCEPTVKNIICQKAYTEREEGTDWKYAMQQIADLPHSDVRYDQSSRVIEEIVGDVLTELRQLGCAIDELVGMQTRVAEVKKLLDLGSNNEVRVVGICGMGGIGKSTLAQVLYNRVSHYFDAFCFLDYVSELLKRDDPSPQEILLQNLETNDPMIWGMPQMILGKPWLRRHKFLIILDGVDFVKNLETLSLVVKSNWLGGGSRIIITTRDERVLQACEVDDVYKLKLLTKDEALQLFCKKAFGCNYPLRGYEELTNNVLEYSNGLPLALVELGSSLRQKSLQEWRSALVQLKRIPNRQIMEVLKKSFDELDQMNKEIFLDIACFFIGWEIDCVKEILHSCDFSTESGIKLLVENSLMTILDGKIQMHNMLQEMGRYIVRQEFPYEPSEWSRLWLLDDIDYVMQTYENTAIERIEAIVLNLEDSKWTTLRIEALSHMNNLRLLIFHCVNFSGTLNCLSNKLRYVSWHQYPDTSLPSRFEPHTLVELIMHDSNITEIWKGKKMLPKLKNFNLCGSKNLITMPDFGGVPNLERLELEGCIGLSQLHPSIAEISKLKVLNLRHCSNLVSIPNSIFSLSYLETLNLACCTKLAFCLNFFPFEELGESETT